MTDNTIFDEQLAEYTDALLNGRSPSAPDSLEDEAHIVRLLHRIIAPDEAISPSFHANLGSRLEKELAQRHPVRKKNKRPPFRWTYRLAAAAAVALVFAAIILVTLGNSSGELSGLANGSIGVIFALFAVTLASALILWITYTNRR